MGLTTRQLGGNLVARDGIGTIRWDQKRKYYIVDVYINGERKRPRFRTKAAADRTLRRLRLEKLGPDRPADHVSLREVFAPYLQHLRAKKKRTSWDHAERYLPLFEACWDSDFNVLELTQDDVDAFVEQHRSRGLRDTTINGYLRTLRAALNRAALRTNPPVLPRVPIMIEMCDQVTPIPTALTKEEVELLLSHAEEPTKTIMLLAVRLGLRQSEIMRLRVSDVDFRDPSRPRLLVRQRKNWEQHSPPLKPKLAEHVKKYIASLKEQGPDAWLFPGYEGKHRSAVSTRARKVFQAAGLYRPELRPGLHLLRRTFASRLLEQGLSLEEVRDAGGWKTIATLRHYLAVYDHRTSKAFELLDDDI